MRPVLARICYFHSRKALLTMPANSGFLVSRLAVLSFGAPSGRGGR